MSNPNLINEFADRVEALAEGLGINNAEFNHTLGWLQFKRYNQVALKEEELRKKLEGNF